MGPPMDFILMLAEDLPKARPHLLHKLRQSQLAQLKTTKLLISGRPRGEVTKCTSHPLCKFYTLTSLEVGHYLPANNAQKVCEELSLVCGSYQLNMTLNSVM